MNIRVEGRSYTIHVSETPSGLLIGTCPQLRGLNLAERSWSEMAASARELIPVLLLAIAERSAP